MIVRKETGNNENSALDEKVRKYLDIARYEMLRVYEIIGTSSGLPGAMHLTHSLVSKSVICKSNKGGEK